MVGVAAGGWYELQQMVAVTADGWLELHPVFWELQQLLAGVIARS